MRKGDCVERWVCFVLGEQPYALPILEVQEVLSEAQIEPVPGAPADTIGVINLRGAIVAVADLRLRLGLATRPSDAHTAIIVLAGEGESLGLRVDRVTQVRGLNAAQHAPPPANSESVGADVISAIHPVGRELIFLLDPKALRQS